MMTQKTTSYPWSALPVSTSPGDYSSRLVSEDINPSGRRLFWALGYMRRPAFIVEYESCAGSPITIPTFKNIRVFDYSEQNSLVIELLDVDMSDFFLKVCLDIISALQNVSPQAIRKATILRLERWSAFLRPSRTKMSLEEQKGLIAELLFLNRDSMAAYEPGVALDGWQGPNRAPRDFGYGQVFVEVKAKRNSSNRKVIISSAEQLNVNPSERVFLHVAELNEAPADSKDSFTLVEVVEETRKALKSPLLQASFDNKLASVGYFDEDDYSGVFWSEGCIYYYAVTDGFPKIDSKACGYAISGVSYQIDLAYCEEFLVDRSVVLEALEQ